MARPSRLAVLVLAYCGLRWGELAALEAKRIDLVFAGLRGGGVLQTGSSSRRCDRTAVAVGLRTSCGLPGGSRADQPSRSEWR
ncbi:MAG: hypothetical protein QOC59_310 [Microbacteriaceae bacterium]|jgi:integrase|nr:hypothetical protein [Microbacteriaceae bacterium]